MTRARRRANIATVARHARVAKSTVSRVLNGGYASDEIKERVNRAIKDLSYSPWTAAVNFASGRAGAFGVVAEDVLGEWLPSILSGVEQELRNSRVSLLINSLALDARYDASIVRGWIDQHRVDGLAFIRPGKAEQKLMRAAAQAHIGLALVGPDIDFGVGAVLRSKNHDAGRDIGRYLAALGHRKIAFIGGPRVSLDSQHRLAGLREGLGEVGVRLPDSHVVFAARYHSDEGRAHALRWLGRGSLAPTAVVLGNDTMAIGFMSTLQAHGIVVPDQVSVVGFDDGPAATWVWPRLTTARQEARTLGLLACRSLVRQLENSDLEPHSVTELPMPLIIRESTGRAPASPTRRRRRSH